jgi:signal transduction histidine kinase
MTFDDFLYRLRRGSPGLRVAAAACTMIVALAVTVAVEPLIGRVPSALLFVAVLVVAWLVGFGPALLTAIGGVLLLDYLTHGRPYRIRFGERDAWWMMFFIAVVLGPAWLLSVLRRLKDELEGHLQRAQQARAEAEAANQAKERFLAVVSHELRTPLTAMLGWVNVLERGNVEPAQMTRAVETIKRNTLLQSLLIDDLLEASRIAADKREISRRPTDFGAVVGAALQLLGPIAQARGVTLASRIDPLNELQGDPIRLQQLVTNLVSNSIKFTPPGGRVDVGLHQEHCRARLVVRDTGQGIEPDVLPQIFEPYRQGEMGLCRQEGLGLGLAIVKHIVEQHGGTVSAHSPGSERGSTFVVELPLMVFGPAEPAIGPPTPVSGSPPGSAFLSTPSQLEPRWPSGQ